MRTGRVLGAAGLLLVAVLGVRTARFTSRQGHGLPAPALAIDDSAAAARLARAVTFRTISYGDSGPPRDALLGLHAYLAATFPATTAALPREIVDGYSLLYTWRGTDTTLRPLICMAHLDVVPIDPATATQWQLPPFSGQIVNGFVWGRGSLDDKAGVLATLEAVEYLVAHGVRPRRTVYLAFGHDEEVGGHGAAAIAALLRSRGVVPEAVLDEGGLITRGVIVGVAAPVALLGIAEKGYLSVALTVDGAGGHSSAPPPETTVGVLSAAVARLEAHPFPARITAADRAFFDAVGPEMSLSRRVLLSNLWLFGPLVTRMFAAAPDGNALVRTTTAPTMFEGSVKDNVLPAHARAVVNFRLLSGDSVAGVLAAVRRIVHDPRVQIAPYGPTQTAASPVASTTSAPYAALSRAVRAVVPDAVVAPYMIVAETDARQYRGLSPNVYGFLPLAVTRAEPGGIHGTNERVAVRGYGDAVRIMIHFIQDMAQ
jgi:carboxypeptidase PM20D1